MPYATIKGEMGPFLTFLVLELQRGYLYQNGVEFRQKVIGFNLNLFSGHLNYSSGGIQTFPLLSVTWASAPIAERTIYIKGVEFHQKVIGTIVITFLAESPGSGTRYFFFYQNGVELAQALASKVLLQQIFVATKN